MSKQWEHDISNSIDGNTPRSIKSYRCGYSGNSKHPQPDILIVDANTGSVHAPELKGPIASKYIGIDAEDCDQIAECINGMTIGYLVVKFQNRRPLTIRYFDDVPNIDGYDEMTVAERFSKIAPPCFDPRVTDSGTLRLTKPELDDWPSARASDDDYICILSDMGIINETSKEADSSLLTKKHGSSYTE